jgi:hypothetical protein
MNRRGVGAAVNAELGITSRLWESSQGVTVNTGAHALQFGAVSGDFSFGMLGPLVDL